MSTVKLKRSAVASKVPLTTDLELGELALNTYDGLLFFKKNPGSESIVTLVTVDGQQTLANKTLTTPNIGVATATSVNKLAITAPATGSTLTIADGKVATISNTLTFTGTDSSSVNFGAGGTVTYTTDKLSAFASTTSSELAGVISDETGSGSLVFATSPSLSAPTVSNGVLTGTLTANSSVGTAGQVLATSGTGTYWVTVGGTRVSSFTSATSVTMNADTTDIAIMTNTQAAGTFTINAPTGTPLNGQKLMFRLKSTNVQTFSWNAIFVGSVDLPLPTASSGTSLTDYFGFVYDSTAAKWQVVAKNFGF